jgi:hypothetical protein
MSHVENNRSLLRQTSSGQTQINRKELAMRVATQISQKRKLPLNIEELTYLTQRIKQVDKKILSQKIEDLLPALVLVYEKELSKLPKPNQYDDIDLQSMLKSEMTKETEASSGYKTITNTTTLDSLLSTPVALQKIFNPAILRYKTYLLLDRKFQSTEANNSTEFKWYVTDTSRVYTSDMAVSTLPIKSITSIKMYPFIFPSSLNALTPSKRLSVEIDELKNQAYIAPAYKKRFHFVFSVQKVDADTYPQYVIDELGQNDCVFDFHNPITELNSVTLCFGNPFRNLALDPDRLYATISSVGAQTRLTFTQAHYLNVDDFVVIENFTTATPTADTTQINLINNVNGNILTGVTSTTATFDIDLSALAGAIVNNPYEIYFESKRFVVRLELTCGR